MNFWDEFKSHFKAPLLLPLFVSSVLVMAISSPLSVSVNTHDDFERISSRTFIFLTSLIIGGATKFYFFFLLGKKKDILKDQNLGDFISKLFIEWTIVEIRIQLRTLCYLLMFILPGVLEGLRLSLAPVHVFFNPKMEQEDFDPIHASRNSLNFNDNTLVTLFFINIFAFGFNLLVTGGNLFSSGAPLFKALMFIFITPLISYIYYIYINYLYFQYLDKQS